MEVKYQVIDNSIKKGRYHPKVVHKGKIKTARIVADIVNETALTSTEVGAVIDALVRRLIYYLQDGYQVEINGWLTFSISLHEDLERGTDRVSDAVKIRIKAKVARGFWRRVVQEIKLRYVSVPFRIPLVITLFDANTSTNEVYTRGDSIKIMGRDMLFDKAAEDEGVFFISVEDGSEVRINSYAHTTERRVLFTVPATIQGPQYVEIRTRYGGKWLRKGRFERKVFPAS